MSYTHIIIHTPFKNTPAEATNKQTLGHYNNKQKETKPKPKPAMFPQKEKKYCSIATNIIFKTKTLCFCFLSEYW